MRCPIMLDGVHGERRVPHVDKAGSQSAEQVDYLVGKRCEKDTGIRGDGSPGITEFDAL